LKGWLETWPSGRGKRRHQRGKEEGGLLRDAPFGCLNGGGEKKKPIIGDTPSVSIPKEKKGGKQGWKGTIDDHQKKALSSKRTKKGTSTEKKGESYSQVAAGKGERTKGKIMGGKREPQNWLTRKKISPC